MQCDLHTFSLRALLDDAQSHRRIFWPVVRLSCWLTRRRRVCHVVTIGQNSGPVLVEILQPDNDVCVFLWGLVSAPAKDMPL